MADVRTTTKVEGPQSSDAPVSDNPVLSGGRASTAVPTPVSTDGDAVHGWFNRSGAAIIVDAPHVGLNADPWSLDNKTVQQGGAATGVAIWTPAGGKKIVVTSYELTVSGTVASDAVLWFGASGDTTYTIGTDKALFYGNFIPSASIAPGIARSGIWVSPTADHVLRLTAGGANTYYVNVWGYEI